MLDILDSGLTKTLITFLLCVSVIILWIIFREGAAEDVKTRHYYGIDRFILPFLSIVILPHIYIAWIMIDNGFLILYIFNLVAIALLWYIGKRGVIGGADAICLIFVALCFPFVVPLVIIAISTLIAERILRWRSPLLDAEWRSGKTPLLLPCKYGYVVTVPLSALFLIFVIL